MLEPLLKALTLLLIIAVFGTGMTWWLVFLWTREKTGEAYQQAKPRELKLRRCFWILLALFAVCCLASAICQSQITGD